MVFQKVDTDELAINTIRTLAADVVNKANSGHPGMFTLVSVVCISSKMLGFYRCTDGYGPRCSHLVYSV